LGKTGLISLLHPIQSEKRSDVFRESLPDDAVILKVTLKVKRQGVAGGGNPVTMFQGFMVDIKNGFFGTAALQISAFQAAANKTYDPLEFMQN
jgi:hypothetical protein